MKPYWPGQKFYSKHIETSQKLIQWAIHEKLFKYECTFNHGLNKVIFETLKIGTAVLKTENVLHYALVRFLFSERGSNLKPVWDLVAFTSGLLIYAIKWNWKWVEINRIVWWDDELIPFTWNWSHMKDW